MFAGRGDDAAVRRFTTLSGPLAWVVLVVGWLLSSPAWALSLVPPPGYGAIDRPRGRDVVVEDESIRVHCGDGETCRFHATWIVHVESPTQIAFGVSRGEVEYVLLDGVATASEPMWGLSNGHGCRVAEDEPEPCVGDWTNQVRRPEVLEVSESGLERRVQAGVTRPGRSEELQEYDETRRDAPHGGGVLLRVARVGWHRVELEGTLSPVHERGLGWGTPVLAARHGVLTRESARTRIVVRGGEAPIRQRVVIEMHSRTWRPVNDREWVVRKRRRGRTLVAEGEPREVLEAEFRSGPRSWVGGPLVAAGLGFTGETRFRLRAGWEVGTGRYFVHRAAVETDFERLLLVPATEVASRKSGRLVPSLGLSAGVPVQVRPTTRVGIRGALTTSWRFFSIVGHFDTFPAMRGDDLELHGGLYGQFSI